MCLSDSLFAKLYESAPDAIFICEQEHVVFANAAAKQMFRLAPGEGSVAPLSSFFANAESPHSPMHNVLKKMRRVDGTEFDAALSVSTVTNDNRQYHQLFVRDVRSHSAATQEGHGNDARLKFLVENADVVLWVMDAKTLQTLYVSDAVTRLQGYTPAEAIEHRFEDTVADAALVDAIKQRVKQKLAEFEQDSRVSSEPQVYASFLPRRCKDGKTVWTEVISKYVRNPQNGRVEILGISRYITEQVMAQRELGEVREYMHTVVDVMPSALIGVSSHGMVSLWNNSAAEISKVPTELALGQRFGELWTTAELLAPTISRVMSTGNKEESFLMPILVDDEMRQFNVVCFPVMQRRQRGVVIRMDDITEQIAMRDLLARSEKMLSIGGLAAGMAHEINNPLGGMMQLSQVIKMRLSESTPANQKIADRYHIEMSQIENYARGRGIFQLLEQVVESGGRAGRIVRNMLNFARQDSSAFELTDILNLVEDTLVLAGNEVDVNRNIDFRKIAIEKDYDTELPWVSCDRGRLQQVLLNLFKNSAQAFTAIAFEPGKWKLRIGLSVLEHDYCIEIEDNGPGIPETNLKNIFKPFYTTKNKAEGTGLGLSICKFIIEQHHQGQIEVTSSLGKGTKFSIRLPLNSSPHHVSN
ncbi:MAG: PAS domain S-box protein [Deltaproteobacteria bacterium]|nr:PAS domain S-box protein [Deltaproteobacteria bacterium]